MESLQIIAPTISSICAIISIIVALKVSNGQKILSQTQQILTRRQLLIPLWDNMKKLRTIDPTNPNWVEIVTTANDLELIALCWEGDLIDKQIIQRTFKTSFMTLWEQIGDCKNPPQGWNDGRAIQRQNRSAGLLYEHLKKVELKQDEISPLDGGRR